MNVVSNSRKGFIHLFVSERLIQGAATALLGIFIPIFLYTTLGENFYVVGIFYATLSLLYVFGVVLGAQIMDKFGTRVSLIIGGVCSVAVYTTLYNMNAENAWLLLLPLGVSIVLFRIFHWVPYHVDFTEFTKRGERGRSLGITYATVAFMGVVGPILAGYIITQSGYNMLFAIAVALLIAATISYAFVPGINEKFVWTFKETWKRLFSKEYRGAALGLYASGAEGTFTIIVWPIFLYELLKGNLLEIGALATFVAGITVIIQLIFGYYLDGKDMSRTKALKVGSVFYSLGWIFKIFVLSAMQVFLVGLYHNVAKIFTQTSFDAMFYDMSADQGHYVDEFTVLREMAIHLGRASCLVVVAILTLFISLQWTFIIGAVAAIALNMLYAVSRS